MLAQRSRADLLEPPPAGLASSFRVQGNLCHVTWADAGITIGFASQHSPCAAGHLFQAAWYGMSFTDRRWHNQLGLRVGMSLAQLRRLYPARFADSGTARGSPCATAATRSCCSRRSP